MDPGYDMGDLVLGLEVVFNELAQACASLPCNSESSKQRWLSYTDARRMLTVGMSAQFGSRARANSEFVVQDVI